MYHCPSPIIHKKTGSFESVFLFVFAIYFRMNLSSEDGAESSEV